MRACSTHAWSAAPTTSQSHTHVNTYIHTYIHTARNKRSVAQQSEASDTRVHLTHMTALQPRGSNFR